MEPMQQAVFAVYILMHVVFTPLEGDTVKYKAKIMRAGLSSQECVNSVNALYSSGSYDPKTNSFGCIRVVHPQDEQRNNNQRQQRRHEGSH